MSKHKIIRGKDIKDFSRQEVEQVQHGIDDYIIDNAERLQDTASFIDENDELCEKIGKAFIIFSMFPEIFGNVSMSKFKALFLDESEVNDIGK